MKTLEIRKKAYQIIDKYIVWKNNEIGYSEAGEEMEDFYNEAVEMVEKLKPRIEGIKKWIKENNQIPEFRVYISSKKLNDWNERKVIEELKKELSLY